LSPDHPHAAIHPLQVLDQLAAGYILDLAGKFGHKFEWRFDLDSLHKLVQLALQHFPGLEISCCEALIGRLRLAGDLAQGDEGLELTSQGDERCRSTFRALLAAPEWHQALEGILEDLTIFAETDGVPFAVGDPLQNTWRQAAASSAF
jgi:hypothetical protein